MERYLKKLALAKITSGDYADRFELDEDALADLASSIQQIGLRQPIEVVETDSGYLIVTGHRRFEACRRLGHDTIDAWVIDKDEKNKRVLTFAENFFKADISPLERAVAIAKVIESGEMTIETIALGLHRSQDWVRRQMAICDWPDDVLALIHSGKVSVAAASNLAVIHDETYRKFLCRQAEDNGATARTTAAWRQAFDSMQPPETAIEQPPLPAGSATSAMIPQAPCLFCTQIKRQDALSYVALCQECLNTIRSQLQPV